MKKVKLSIIIVSYNTAKITTDCIKSVIKNTENLNYEIIVIDNASSDDSVSEIKRIRSRRPGMTVRAIQNKTNIGFAGANNQGLKVAKGEYLLFLNSDTIISDNAIGEMVELMNSHPRIGIASCMLKNKDGSIQATGGYFPTLPRVFTWMTIQDFPLTDRFVKPFHPMKEKSLTKADSFYRQAHYLDWVTGAFFLTRKKVFEDIGQWDEKYFMYTEEVDVCFRAKKKQWQVYYTPKFSIFHLGGASGTREASILREFEGVKRFYRKHYQLWQFPILRLLLKVGSLGRIVLLGIIEGKETAKIYAKAFQKA